MQRVAAAPHPGSDPPGSLWKRDAPRISTLSARTAAVGETSSRGRHGRSPPPIEERANRDPALSEHDLESVHPTTHPSRYDALSGDPKLRSTQTKPRGEECTNHQAGELAQERHREQHADHYHHGNRRDCILRGIRPQVGKRDKRLPPIEPIARQVKTKPSCAAESCSSLSAITGKSAGIIEITSEKSTFLKRTTFMPCE